jgi:hypothetical protein
MDPAKVGLHDPVQELERRDLLKQDRDRQPGILEPELDVRPLAFLRVMPDQALAVEDPELVGPVPEVPLEEVCEELRPVARPDLPGSRALAWVNVAMSSRSHVPGAHH